MTTDPWATRRLLAGTAVLVVGWLVLWAPPVTRWDDAVASAASTAATGVARGASAAGGVLAEAVGATAADDTDGTAPPSVVDGIGTARSAAAGGGPVTLRGSGAFADLAVTVSKTTDLVNETVSITWSGGAPTKDRRAFDADYLQVMQCWGDAADGPDRSQCQFGGRVGFDDRGGRNAASRNLVQTYVDAADPLLEGAVAGADVFVPFQAVSGETVSGQDVLKNPFYDSSSTNEITYGRTRGDGTGNEFMEIQTYLEASGLGCGQVVSGTPRPCWLVVVPRGDTEVDGTPWETVFNNGSHRLDSSPLSLTNWKNRIVFPLTFSPGGSLCSLDAAQRPVAGVESGIEAVIRWQPKLCADNGPVFAYNQVADSVAERQLLTDDPGLSVVEEPVDGVPDGTNVAYAPITVSALAIGVQIERLSPADATDDQRARDGTRIGEVNLTPRLVAKLLTQSYLWGVRPTARYLKANPDNITKDPDFLAANPVFAELDYPATIDVVVPLGNGRSIRTLWQWIAQDQDALDFLAGLPDPWGMRVNPFYQGVDLDRDDVPKVDPYCDGTIVPTADPLCTLDAHPYAQDLREATRAAARGDTLSRTSWDPNSSPPAWKKASAQLGGERRLMALTDTPLAARFQVVPARLRNAAGAFVAPTDASIRAGVAAMLPSGTKNVLLPDPASLDRKAYPLVVVAYAAAATNKLTAEQAKDYAVLLRYAARAGQTPGTGQGQLPEGYVPLDAKQRRQLLDMADAVARRQAPPAAPEPSPEPTSDNPPSSGGSAAQPPAPTPEPTGTAGTAAPTPTADARIVTNPTPATPVGRIRDALSVALLLGVIGSLVGPLVPRLTRRLGQ